MSTWSTVTGSVHVYPSHWVSGRVPDHVPQKVEFSGVPPRAGFSPSFTAARLFHPAV